MNYSYSAQVLCNMELRTIPHAVSSAGGNTYSYDCNGNQRYRVISGQTYTLSYDGENRLTGVSGAATATFVYDGDGQRVKATVGGTTTAYLGNYFEWTGSTSTMVKYFYASGKRVAMKKGSTVYFLLSDHLGSTTLTTTSSGAYSAELRYKAWGETRYTNGTTQTQRHFTGQIEESTLGLYFYNARWYDPLVGRFTQADSIVPNPGKSSDWDRYSYTRNNPLHYIDPTGHWTEDELNKALGEGWLEKYFGENAVFQGREKLLEFLLSENSTDPFTLEIVRTLFNTAYGAHGIGLNFSGIDALGARISFSGGESPGIVGVSVDVVLNLTSGEFSYFGSFEGGIVIGATATVVGGVTLLSNLPSNYEYRGTAKIVGIMGGHTIGLNAEKFWGGVHRFQNSSDVMNGVFVGVGGSIPSPNIGFYGSLSYAFELLSVDQTGYKWGSFVPGPLEVIIDIGNVLWNDILGLPR